MSDVHKIGETPAKQMERAIGALSLEISKGNCSEFQQSLINLNQALYWYTAGTMRKEESKE